MSCCPEISRVLPRLEAVSPRVLFWVSSASGLARAVTIDSCAAYKAAESCVDRPAPAVSREGGCIATQARLSVLEFNAQNRMEAWRTLPRLATRTIYRVGRGSGEPRRREWMTESFLDCGKAVLPIVGLLAPRRRETSLALQTGMKPKKTPLCPRSQGSLPCAHRGAAPGATHIRDTHTRTAAKARAPFRSLGHEIWCPSSS